jgi:glycosyltransferase involved in cell wall biosynthesis
LVSLGSPPTKNSRENSRAKFARECTTKDRKSLRESRRNIGTSFAQKSSNNPTGSKTKMRDPKRLAETRKLGFTLKSPLIVHSHLRWDFVWQRPQQLLTRFAEKIPVLFVEEPVFADDLRAAHLDLSTPSANVTRAIPRLPATFRDDYDAAVHRVRALLHHELRPGTTLGKKFERPVQWFYTPMPAPAMLGHFEEVAVVYDCMDELSKFRFAHPDLVRRESLLLSKADVVFTGGHHLYESKSKHHKNVHFFGCGVDVDHFAQARSPDTPVPTEIAALPRPVLGYYGVIDERLDYTLIAAIAKARPDWQIVMVGPVVKVDPAELPQADNIHWLGARKYAELPAVVKGFDVCLMPFALNEATEFINPTKTLEYMATAKPIVSTAVTDVVRNFTPVVSIGYDPAEFTHCVETALRNPDATVIDIGLKRAAGASWEGIVVRMAQLIQSSIAQNEPVSIAAVSKSAAEAALSIA